MIWICFSLTYLYILNNYFKDHKKLGAGIYFCLLIIYIILSDSVQKLEHLILNYIGFVFNLKIFYIIKIKFILIFIFLILLIRNFKFLLAKFVNGYFNLVFTVLENKRPSSYFTLFIVVSGHYCTRYIYNLNGFDNFIIFLMLLATIITILYSTILLSLLRIFLFTIQSKQKYITKSYIYCFKLSEKSLQKKIVRFVRKNLTNQNKNICCCYHH